MMAAQLQQASGVGAPGLPGKSSQNVLDEGAATAPSTEPLRNRAAESNSPYVRSLTGTPVLWQLLDDEAVERAKKEKKLIFLHVGFLACHYCRMTIQDSFSNQDVASLLNEYFIPIAVDREERPDVDAIYWNYLQLVNSSAGWPINVFLTPDLEPVFGGTYWPGPGSEDSVRDGMDSGEEDSIGFLGILQKLRQSWSDREGQCRTEAKDSVVQLQKFAAEGTLGPRGLLKPNEAENVAHLSRNLDLDIDQLDDAYSQLKKTFDPVNGGFGVVPKFVTPAKYAFLLQLASLPKVVQQIIGEAEVENAAQMALYTLRKIRNSGLHDHLLGGFTRASHTINWTLPYFEKLVADNGFLLRLYLDAWLYTIQKSGGAGGAEAEFGDVVYSLASYLSSAPIALPSGGFASSEAADSFYRKGDLHMREGAYYLWTRREFDAVVGGKNSEDGLETKAAAAYWNVQQHGNVDQENDPDDDFINQNVLYVNKDASELARQFGISREDVVRIATASQKKLAAHRIKERVRPPVDDKVVVAANSIVIGALARTGAALKNGGYDVESGTKYTAVAKDAARFIKTKLWDAQEGVLYRTYSNGKRATVPGFAEDYTFLIEGLLELYEATGELEWLQWADELQKRQIDLFYDRSDVPPTSTHSSSGGFYRSSETEAFNILRLKDGMDTTWPATNGVAASNLFRLGNVLGDDEYTWRARETIHAFEVEMLQHSWLFPTLLSQIVPAKLGGRRFAYVSPAEPSAAAATTTDAAGPLVQYFRSPRAGLRTIAFVEPSTSSSAWLTARSPSLASLAAAQASSSSSSSSSSTGGFYVFVNDAWQAATAADLAQEGEAI